MKEKRLIKQMQAGNQDALDEFISQMYPQIYSYVYVRMKGQDCSKDITQEVFINFIKNIDRFEFRGKTKHYLLRTAVNCCNSWYRKQKEIIHDERVEEVASGTTVVKSNDLRILLHQLPFEQEEVLVLKYYEELKIKEIADILSISENTVKTRARLGLAKLKTMMTKEDWL